MKPFVALRPVRPSARRFDIPGHRVTATTGHRHPAEIGEAEQHFGNPFTSTSSIDGCNSIMTWQSEQRQAKKKY